MKIASYLSALLILVACTNQPKPEQQTVEKATIVSLNGTLTEILVELGKEKEIVGVDVTSTFPKSIENKVQLGHVSRLNTEQIIALHPTHVFVFREDLSPALKQQLNQAKINIVAIERTYSVQGTIQVVKEVAEALQEQEKGKELAERIRRTSKVNANSISKKPKVLFVYARGAGTLMVAGAKTPLDKMIQLAGGTNAAVGFEDYKPLTSEAVIAAQPDVILMFDSGMQSLGKTNVFDLPGVAMTPAGKNKKIITMDGQLLSGFGPRIGEALRQLQQELTKI